MRRSSDRILASHAGTIPRPRDLQAIYEAGGRQAEFQARLPGAVKEVVQHQARIGLDVVNDDELSKQVRLRICWGSDCGVGSRVWNDEIAWAKFEAIVNGARIASAELWSTVPAQGAVLAEVRT